MSVDWYSSGQTSRYSGKKKAEGVLRQGLLGRGVDGGTTVAGTMILAHLAGIDVFATGGIGGVHAGGEFSLDISADLRELGRTQVAVVSSGCKSFLDIPRTLEYLETEGVVVATFTDDSEDKVDFPAFWTRESGVRSPAILRNEREAAAIICRSSFLFLDLQRQCRGRLTSIIRCSRSLVVVSHVPQA